MELKDVENKMLPFINFINKQFALINVIAIDNVISKNYEQLILYMTFRYVQLRMTDLNNVLSKLEEDKNIRNISVGFTNSDDNLYIFLDLNSVIPQYNWNLYII
jgi:hypothetical protein